MSWLPHAQTQTALRCLAREQAPGHVLLVDCLTLWLSNWLCSENTAGWQAERHGQSRRREKKGKSGCHGVISLDLMLPI